MREQPAGYYLVNSVEEGVKLVKDFKNNAVMAGRETLFFDIQRFGNNRKFYTRIDPEYPFILIWSTGPSNFHLSEKLNTAYSAIALQLGCPFTTDINRM